MVAKPLIVLGNDGSVLDACLMNEKAFNKSTEHGALWCLNADNGRVLPYRGSMAFATLEEGDTAYRARVDAGEWKAYSRDEGSDATLAADGHMPSSGGGAWGSALRALETVIRERKETLPEGSYTSYLFGSGEAKIRKKTGEEAIELVLAGTSEEVASESADLIYHLFVLLAQLEISFDRVIEELEGRG